MFCNLVLHTDFPFIQNVTPLLALLEKKKISIDVKVFKKKKALRSKNEISFTSPQPIAQCSY